MKSIQLPFLQKNNHLIKKQSEDEDQKKQNGKLQVRKCLIQSTYEQAHSKHPFFYQLQYYYKLQNVELPEELTKQIYFIKLLSIKEGYNYSEILQMCCQVNNLLFSKQALLNLRDNNSFLSECNQSFTSSIINEKLQERTSDILPEVNINKYIEQIKSNSLSINEIYEEIQKCISNKSNQEQKKQMTSFQSANQKEKNSKKSQNNILKNDYKLPPFQAKGFLACPKNLKSQIIEFLENNADKPYPSTILALSYFHGLQDSIQKSEQLGKQFIKNISPFKYFDLGQSILIGLEQGDALLSQFIFFILNCAEGVIDDQTLNDDLSLFFGNGLSSNLLINLFATFDSDNNFFEKLQQSLDKLQNYTSNSSQLAHKNAEQLNQIYQSFKNFFWDKTDQFEKQFSQIFSSLVPQNTDYDENYKFFTNQNNSYFNQFIVNSENYKDNIYSAFAIEMLLKIGLKLSIELDQNQIINLLIIAADKQHVKAFSKLALILYNQYNKLDQIVQQKLITYLDQGCDLLIPTCMKVKIQLKILGENNIRDYKLAYQLMKDLFYLGSDCFRFDMIRLAKFYKDYDFLSLYCDYLKSVGEKNINILLGLLYEKGYGRQKNLQQAHSIYSSLIEQQKQKTIKKIDVSLYYRMGKILLIQNKDKESEQYFSQIISYASNNFQKFDILSHYKVGKMYEKGNGVNKNLKKAEEIYQSILTYDKDKSIFNSIFNIQSSQLKFKMINGNIIMDKKNDGNNSPQFNIPLYNSISQSPSQRNIENQSESTFSRFQSNLNSSSKINKQEPENNSLLKEKLWENISKNLIIKQRLVKMKSACKNKQEECDAVLDLDEFEGYQNGFLTHYFSNTQNCKPSNIIFQQQNILFIQ